MYNLQLFRPLKSETLMSYFSNTRETPNPYCPTVLKVKNICVSMLILHTILARNYAGT